MHVLGKTSSVIHLRSVSYKSPPTDSDADFPFSVPAIRTLGRLEFLTDITLLVGENGSGKSTLLESVALAANLPSVGSEVLDRDNTLGAQRALAARLRLSWARRTRRGFFLRAEDFFGFAKELAKLRVELQQRLRDVDVEYADRSAWAHGLAAGPARGSLAALEGRYGVNLDANSHGESFLKLFQSRFVPDGLYLLDEPEAALSPQSQLALLALVKQMTAKQCQFLIATHSPILMAFPGATIYQLEGGGIRSVAYAELEPVTLTREFLANPERYLRHL